MTSGSKKRLLLYSAAACLSLLAISNAKANNDKTVAQDASANTALQPVRSLDIERYAGTWYEIARYPNFFQRQCAADTQAEYKQRPDGLIDVINRCKTAAGKEESVQGLARPDRQGPPMASKLQVRFAPAWLSGLPFVWAHYWVVVLDPDYRYAVVSEPKRKYLWILSRTPHMDATTYQSILTRLSVMGFDTNRLINTVQHGD